MKLFLGIRDQHHCAVSNLERMIKTSKDVLKDQKEKYSDNVDRLNRSENLVKELLDENESLVTAIQNLQKLNFNNNNLGGNKYNNLIKTFSNVISTKSNEE